LTSAGNGFTGERRASELAAAAKSRIVNSGRGFIVCFKAMELTGERNRSFAVDQPCDVRRIARIET